MFLPRRTQIFLATLIAACLLVGCTDEEPTDAPSRSQPLPEFSTAPLDTLDLASAPDRTCDGWQLVFVDNFDDEAVDPGKWNIYNYPGHANNGLRRPEAVSVVDGILTITAREIDGTIVSGGIGTHYAQTFGRFEVRVRAEPDPNALTSAVVLTWPASNNWPEEGENNIYETGPSVLREPFSSFVHYPDGSDGGSHVDFTHNASGTEWHQMVMEWTPEDISFWLDGRPAGTMINQDLVPVHPHVMTVQLDAMRTDVFLGEAKMEVDWVRIYQQAPRPTTCGSARTNSGLS